MDLSPDEDNFAGRLLHQAALWDNVELLEELLASGCDVDSRDDRQRTALHAAALAERSRCLVALCRAGANLDVASDEGTGVKTALHIASERGHVENIRNLLRSGASLGCLDREGNSALALAERAGHRHAARELREARDALERERLRKHSELRELVTKGDVQGLKTRLAALGSEAGLIVNLTPGGANTLLYVASEMGNAALLTALLEAGADGRAHPVTKYCPLYIACYRGHLEVAGLLLAQFPEAVQQETVEKWLPLHAACIGGHPALVTLLLEYRYPESLMNIYSDPTGQHKYKAAFDVNASDVSGQTALYVACTLGNLALVEALLAHFVTKLEDENEKKARQAEVNKILSPQRAGISMGIHAIVSKLTGQSYKQESPANRIRPVCMDGGAHGDSCLAAAARLPPPAAAGVARALLDAGALADAPAKPPDIQCDTERQSRARPRSSSAASGRSSSSPSPCRSPTRSSYDDDREGPWTALAIAARAKNIQLIELLVSRGAPDPQCRALREAVAQGLHSAVPLLLAAKAYPDPDFKINQGAAWAAAAGGAPALRPAQPVIVNWRDLRCHCQSIRMRWLEAASLHVNTRLGGAGALLAVTRLEISNNDIRQLPPELFTMHSLRHLNAAQNKLERLPTLEDIFEEEDQKTRRRKRPDKTRPMVYSAPVLQDLYLQDNRLESLPPELFSLPSLSSLDVSNNKLRSLPAAVWDAPALKELNAALNHLKDLPGGDENQLDTKATQVRSPTESSVQSVASPSGGKNTKLDFGGKSKFSTRSPSLVHSGSEASLGEEEGVVQLGDRTGNAVSTTARRPHQWRGVSTPAPPPSPGGSPLTSLNLSHNQFNCVPAVLACRASSLQRLNMAYNSLRSMSYVTSYPTTLRQLDLSHNEITCWPSLPQLEAITQASPPPLRCYCPGGAAPAPPSHAPAAPAQPRAQLLNAACGARRHLRLDSLRTLILANNMLTRIQLTTDDDGSSESADEDHNPQDDEENEWGTSSSSLKGRLLFPLLSMLDVSCNLLRFVPKNIYALSNLAVLNLSGNKDISTLPPQLGLLSRLWNLSLGGCPLGGALGEVARGRGRSSAVVGYLRSLLQKAERYAVMKLMLVGLQGIGKTSLLECLRHESAAAHRRKQTEHWAKRMGNKSTYRGNLSTVGVDIGTWIYEKQRSQKGPVTFRTWDFGGQQEYYATHQYFLSKRSLYLVVWKVTEGRKGLAGAIQWLRSIQARAPGSPVIMVGTHYDQVLNSNMPENESPEVLQRLIRSSIMAAPDADKLGLPRVLDSVEVSCSTKHNIRLLADIIYSVAFSVKPPGSKEPLLEQRIPATYLALEECVTHLANELKEPVLNREEFKRLVTQYMQQKNHRTFRDAAEFHQATMFLHENGVLLHYDDATLKELYFLRPQWLCDVLAHVVTIKEINPFASNGIMRIDDLAHVFKASPALARGEEATSLGLSLLNKFELALCWDARSLLVPPLLPPEEPLVPQLPLRTRCRSRGTPLRPRPPALSTNERLGADSPTLIHEPVPAVTITARDSGRALQRLLIMSYVPQGFWPRLVSRLLADDVTMRVAPYSVPSELDLDEATTKALDLNWSWKLWQTGMSLVCSELTLLSIRELPAQCDELLGPALAADRAGADAEEHPLYNVKFRLQLDGSWSELELWRSSCIQLLLPAAALVARRAATPQTITIEPNPEILAKLLAQVSDHVDLLLEDWYPSLGTRFVHTSEGRCLITRAVPCPACLKEPLDQPDPAAIDEALRRLDVGGGRPPRRSQDSRTSDGDSGVGADSNASSRLGSVERPPARAGPVTRTVTAWTVEQCLAAASEAADLQCVKHGAVDVAAVAPDALFLDVEEDKRARWSEITLGPVIGRGAFGVVHAAGWRSRAVALKALQPVEPRGCGDRRAAQAYKAALSRWERAPGPAASRAHCALRQELSILSALRHAHVAPAIAVCARPLCLLLERAPEGALDSLLRSARGVGARLGPRVVRLLALQVARALEYLHARRVVYRDLKSENVLVWSMPKPQDAAAAERSPDPIDVHVKLGDYGISRLALPSGTKGFGGTEGFMAPEIMRYNGEEEYNEKVDCFSYGMLLYELLTLRQPFEGHEAVKEAVLEGARPPLAPRDLQYPCCMLETMRRCWASAPDLRPAAAALACVCAAAEFTALWDVAAVPAMGGANMGASAPAAAIRVANVTEEGGGGWEVYRAGGGRALALLATSSGFTTQHSFNVPPVNGESVNITAMCTVGTDLWLADTAGRICVYSASTLCLLWSADIPAAVGEAAAGVAALQPLPDIDRVAVAMACGRLFLVSRHPAPEEGSFVLSELGAASELSCLAATTIEGGYVVWAGGAELWSYPVGAGGARGAARVQAPPISLLAGAEGRVLAASVNSSIVYQWCSSTLQLTGQLDCSKLAPCSESLQSLAIDEERPGSSQVTALCAASGHVYAGTAWGSVVVAEAGALRPVTVCRPHEARVSAILPLGGPRGAEGGALATLATLGTGYRPLVQRFLPQTSTQQSQPNTTTDDYCLLWKTNRWLPD